MKALVNNQTMPDKPDMINGLNRISTSSVKNGFFF